MLLWIGQWGPLSLLKETTKNVTYTWRVHRHAYDTLTAKPDINIYLPNLCELVSFQLSVDKYTHLTAHVCDNTVNTMYLYLWHASSLGVLPAPIPFKSLERNIEYHNKTLQNSNSPNFLQWVTNILVDDPSSVRLEFKIIPFDCLKYIFFPRFASRFSFFKMKQKKRCCIIKHKQNKSLSSTICIMRVLFQYPSVRVFHSTSLNKFKPQLFCSAKVLSSVWLGQHTGGPLPQCFLYLGP